MSHLEPCVPKPREVGRKRSLGLQRGPGQVCKERQIGDIEERTWAFRDLGKLHASISVCDSVKDTKEAWWIKYGYLSPVSRAPNTLKRRFWLCHSLAVFVNSCLRGRALTQGMSTECTWHWGSLLSYKSVGPGEAGWASSSRARCCLLPTESCSVQIFYFHTSSVASVILRFKGK